MFLRLTRPAALRKANKTTARRMRSIFSSSNDVMFVHYRSKDNNQVVANSIRYPLPYTMRCRTLSSSSSSDSDRKEIVNIKGPSDRNNKNNDPIDTTFKTTNNNSDCMPINNNDDSNATAAGPATSTAAHTASATPPKVTAVPWQQQLRSPPNLITLSRIGFTPLLAYWIVTGQPAEYALAGCLAAGLSDGLDGHLAKRYNMKTRLGSYLDPIADKILINSLAMALWIPGTLPTPLAALWFTKDALLLTGTAYVVFVKDKEEQALEVQPTRMAKVSTALQFATIGLGIVVVAAESAGGTATDTIIFFGRPYGWVSETFEALCWMTGFSTIASGLSYMDMSAFARGNSSNGHDEKLATSHNDKKKKTQHD